VHLIGGAHNDALTVAFLLAGLMMMAGPSRRIGALVAGGALLGLSTSVKPTIGVVLPFAAVFAAGGPSLFSAAYGLPRSRRLSLLIQRGGAVMGAALGTLVALSFASGLGLGWATALSGAGKSVSWTSPPTALGIAVEAIGKWFGVHLAAVPGTRGVALAALPIALLAILWQSRIHDPLYTAGLACLAVIFLAPITQPWYLIWPLALVAATAVRARWLAGTIVFSMFTILPDGNGALRPLQVPLSFLMSALIGWVVYRALRSLHRFEPTEIDFAASADAGTGACPDSLTRSATGVGGQNT
jgi:hypothetical protein